MKISNNMSQLALTRVSLVSTRNVEGNSASCVIRCAVRRVVYGGGITSGERKPTPMGTRSGLDARSSGNKSELIQAPWKILFDDGSV